MAQCASERGTTNSSITPQRGSQLAASSRSRVVSSASAPVGNASGPGGASTARELVQGRVVTDQEHPGRRHRPSPPRARERRRPTRGRARARLAPRARRVPAGRDRESPARAPPVEQSTRSGRTSFASAQRAMRFAAFSPAGRERPVVIGETRMVPARLRVAQDPEALHQPRLQPRTSSVCPDVSGEGRSPAIPTRSSAIRAIGSPSSSPWRISQQPITVPVRPTPPQQCTYAVPPSAPRCVDVVEDPHHVARGRRSHVGDRVRDPAQPSTSHCP